MPTSKLPGAAALLSLLAACDAKIGEAADNATADNNAQTSAEGRAEEGRISIDTPGFDLSINIPKEATRQVHSESDSRILYPGAAIGGIHVAGGTDDGGGEVEMRFSTPDAPDKVAGWYRDPARADGFTLKSAGREGQAYVISGVETGKSEAFKVRLEPRDGGGTDGRLMVRSQG
jgi:hypothetical protein